MNSKRDRVKDAIRDCLRDDDRDDADFIACIADAVFEALNISEKAQDRP